MSITVTEGIFLRFLCASMTARQVASHSPVNTILQHYSFRLQMKCN